MDEREDSVAEFEESLYAPGSLSEHASQWPADCRHSASANNDAESAGAPSGGQADQVQLLGHAGMVLRDPATFHLVIHQVGYRLHAEHNGAPCALPSDALRRL